MQSDEKRRWKNSIAVFLLQSVQIYAKLMKNSTKGDASMEKKSSGEQVRFSVCVSQELAAYIDRFCSDFGCTRSGFVTVILGQYVRNQEAQKVFLKSLCEGVERGVTDAAKQLSAEKDKKAAE